MHYTKNWLFTMGTYIVVYIEIIVLLFVFYGKRFSEEPISGAIIDSLYYVIVFAWFTGATVLAVRTYEITERQSFYAKHQQEQEARAWKKLLSDLPEPVIFTVKGEISFFNAATLGLFDVPGADLEDQRKTVAAELEKVREKTLKKSLMRFIMEEAVANTEDSILGRETWFVYSNEERKVKKHLLIKCVKTVGTEREGNEYIFHDITALKDLEQNKAKQQCFDLLLATASHDIRTPLNLLLGVIEILSEHINTPLGKEQLNIANSCGHRMIQYLKGLDLIRRVNLGTLEREKKIFPPEDLVKGIVSSMEFSAAAKNLKINFITSPGIPATFCSDKEMYAIVLQNLVENAIKYTFAGGVTVTLRFSDPLLTTTITDTGIGMTEEQLNAVGILFQKSKLKRTLNPQGFGLGLFLAKTLAEHLEGTLEIYSVPDKGTTAVFTLPHATLDESRSERGVSELTSLPNTNSGPIPEPECDCAKILLVDDEPFNLLVLSAFINSVGVKCDKAENGQIALDMIEQKRSHECCKGYTVVFMDVNMPVLDGIETTSKIRQMVEDATIPQCSVVGVTAASRLDSTKVYAGYIAKGFSQVLAKPVQKADFLHVLRKYISY